MDTAVGDKATTAYVDQQDAALLAPADVLAGANITVAVANGQVTISGQAGGGGGANPTSFSATEPDAATYGFWAET